MCSDVSLDDLLRYSLALPRSPPFAIASHGTRGQWSSFFPLASVSGMVGSLGSPGQLFPRVERGAGYTYAQATTHSSFVRPGLRHVQFLDPELFDGGTAHHHDDVGRIGEHVQYVVDDRRKVDCDRGRGCMGRWRRLRQQSPLETGGEERREWKEMLAVSETEARRGAAYGDHEVDAAFREEGVQVARERIFGVRLGKPRRLDRRLEELDRSRRKLRQLSAKPGANSSKGAKFGPNEYRMSPRLWGVSWAITLLARRPSTPGKPRPIGSRSCYAAVRVVEHWQGQQHASISSR